MAAFRNEPSFPFPGEKRIADSHPNKSNNQILFKDFAKGKVSKMPSDTIEAIAVGLSNLVQEEVCCLSFKQTLNTAKFTTVGSKASSYFIL